MSSWHHHLLCVLQSFNFIVLLLYLELQCLPLVGKGQPLLPEKKYVWHDRNSHISIEIAHIFFYKNHSHMREKDIFCFVATACQQYLRTFVCVVNNTCVLLKNTCLLWRREYLSMSRMLVYFFLIVSPSINFKLVLWISFSRNLEEKNIINIKTSNHTIKIILNFISISLSAYRMFMSSTISSISGNVCCLFYLSLYTLMLSEPKS